jgi:hypothetical protein
MPTPYKGDNYTTPKGEREEQRAAISEAEQVEECFCEGDHCEWDPDKGSKALAFLKAKREGN